MAPLKLKINTGGPIPAPSSSSVSTPGAKPPGSALKLTFKTPGAPASATEPPAADPLAQPVKQKRKYTKKPKDVGDSPAKSKKRALEDDEAGAPANKRTKSLSIKLPKKQELETPISRTPSISLKLKPNLKTPKSATRVVLKAKGQKPERPFGVGYDSEAEDAEDDPAIESQFILRMVPGEDCDTLRKAIEERTIGEQHHVSFRFWDREGRRVSVKINSRVYAAVLVDLPCIIEGTKSWDKKGWYKAADISQMLLVLGRATDEKDAQNFPLPPEIGRVYEQQDRGLYQYPHGLTPPMHFVRKRRFKKRTNYRTIEAVEEEIERLIALDEEAKAAGGDSTFETIDREVLHHESEEDEEAEQEEDAAGKLDAFGEADEDADGMSEDDMAAMMMAELDDDEQPTPQTAISANEAALHALGAEASQSILPTTEGATPQLVESPAAASPAAETPGATDNTEGTDDEDDDDDDEEAEEEEADEEALQAQQEKAQLREEIADLEKEVEIAMQQRDKQQNALLRNRANQKLQSLQQDLNLKKNALGENEED